MSIYRYIALDSYPLSNAAASPATPGTQRNPAEDCHQWMLDCEAAGITLLVPAIAYYECARDLHQRQATKKIARFEQFCFDPTRFRLPAEEWENIKP